jgi:hypothetical protein
MIRVRNIDDMNGDRHAIDRNINGRRRAFVSS